MKFIIAAAALVLVVAMASLAQAGNDGPIFNEMGWNNIDLKDSIVEKRFKSVEECSKFFVGSENCAECCKEFKLWPTAGSPTLAVPGYSKCRCVTLAEKDKLTSGRRASLKFPRDF